MKNTQIIKKGRKGILHLPQVLPLKNSYNAIIRIDRSMLYISDAQDGGWSKLWGVAFGHIHWNNSVRIGIRVIEGRIVLGYYCYIGGVSPQTNPKQKGFFNQVDVYVGDLIELNIDFVYHTHITVKNLTSGVSETAKVDLLKGFRFPPTLCYPNIKDKASRNIYFNFTKTESMKTRTKIIYAATVLIISFLAVWLRM